MNAIQLASVTMTSGEWRQRLAQLCQQSALAEPGEEVAMLRLGHALLSNQPDPRSCVADHLPPAAQFEALLAAGAHDSAAFALMPGTGSYIVSRAGEGGCIASVMLPGMDEEMTSEAESPALALMSALAAALASCGAACQADCKERHEVRIEGAVGEAEAAMALAGHDEVAEESMLWQRPLGVLLH